MIKHGVVNSDSGRGVLVYCTKTKRKTISIVAFEDIYDLFAATIGESREYVMNYKEKIILDGIGWSGTMDEVAEEAKKMGCFGVTRKNCSDKRGVSVVIWFDNTMEGKKYNIARVVAHEMVHAYLPFWMSCFPVIGKIIEKIACKVDEVIYSIFYLSGKIGHGKWNEMEEETVEVDISAENNFEQSNNCDNGVCNV